MSEPLTRQQYVEYCKNCANKSFNSQTGLICGLTNEKPNFSGSCEKYSPVDNELNDVQRQVEHIKVQSKKKKIILISLLVSIVTILTSYVLYHKKK